MQETRGWDEAKQATFHQRLKEGSADYRYFPEPDIPKFTRSEVPEFSDEALLASLPELPWTRRERYKKEYGLKAEDVGFIVGTSERSAFFDAVAEALDHDTALIARAANYLTSDLAGIYADAGEEGYAALEPAAFAKLIRMTAAGDLSSRGAKDTLVLLVEKGGDPETLAKGAGLIQVHDEAALADIVGRVLREEGKAVSEYRAGKEAALQYLVGKAMKESRGAGNPVTLRELFVQELSGGK